MAEPLNAFPTLNPEGFVDGMLAERAKTVGDDND